MTNASVGAGRLRAPRRGSALRRLGGAMGPTGCGTGVLASALRGANCPGRSCSSCGFVGAGGGRSSDLLYLLPEYRYRWSPSPWAERPPWSPLTGDRRGTTDPCPNQTGRLGGDPSSRWSASDRDGRGRPESLHAGADRCGGWRRDGIGHRPGPGDRRARRVVLRRRRGGARTGARATSTPGGSGSAARSRAASSPTPRRTPRSSGCTSRSTVTRRSTSTWSSRPSPNGST